jgi:hypothetical protein
MAIDALPYGLILDVLEVPRQENLSTVLKKGHVGVEVSEAQAERKSLLERVLQLF